MKPSNFPDRKEARRRRAAYRKGNLPAPGARVLRPRDIRLRRNTKKPGVPRHG